MWNAQEATLKHEVALLGVREVRAPALYRQCAGDSRHPLARAIADASSGGLLRCVVCGSRVIRKFGDKRQWHFALAGNESCDHEPESVAHREAKLALYEHLKRLLEGAGWNVFKERKLENDRRPDVLAVGPANEKLAFEVQYSELSAGEWGQRHRAYADLGVRDLWILGPGYWGRSRSSLVGLIAATEGQRLMYSPVSVDEEGLQLREPVLYDGERYLKPGGVATDQVFRGLGTDMASYGLAELVVRTDDGSISTPADALWSELEEARRNRERSRLAPRRPEIEQEDEHVWLASEERARMVELLGKRLLSKFEVPGPNDDNLRFAPGRWKSMFFIENVWGRVGDRMDFHKSSGRVLGLYRYEGVIQPAWQALADFRDLLEREGYIRSAGSKTDPKRYWTVVRDSDA